MLTSVDDMDEKIKELEKRLDKIEEDKTKSENILKILRPSVSC